MLTEGDILRIADRIVRGYSPLVVGTFGSYAVGRATASSDLDLLVIKKTSVSAAVRAQTIRQLLFGVLNKLDAHVFTPLEFERSAAENYSFAWMIAKQARIYHASDEARNLVPSLFCRADIHRR